MSCTCLRHSLVIVRIWIGHVASKMCSAISNCGTAFRCVAPSKNKARAHSARRIASFYECESRVCDFTFQFWFLHVAHVMREQVSFWALSELASFIPQIEKMVNTHVEWEQLLKSKNKVCTSCFSIVLCMLQCNIYFGPKTTLGVGVLTTASGHQIQQVIELVNTS